MTSEYKPGDIETKWQKKWEADGLYQANIDPSKKKFYALTMLPSPSRLFDIFFPSSDKSIP